MAKSFENFGWHARSLVRSLVETQNPKIENDESELTPKEMDSISKNHGKCPRNPNEDKGCDPDCNRHGLIYSKKIPYPGGEKPLVRAYRPCPIYEEFEKERHNVCLSPREEDLPNVLGLATEGNTMWRDGYWEILK